MHREREKTLREIPKLQNKSNMHLCMCKCITHENIISTSAPLTYLLRQISMTINEDSDDPEA